MINHAISDAQNKEPFNKMAYMNALEVCTSSRDIEDFLALNYFDYAYMTSIEIDNNNQ